MRAEVGLPITVGTATTKFLAKVASGLAEPDGLLVVPPGGELDLLHRLPVWRLWGVGPTQHALGHEPRTVEALDAVLVGLVDRVAR